MWGGSGSEAYQAVQMRWDSTSAELNAALQNLAQTVSEAGATMAQTEAGVTGMFDLTRRCAQVGGHGLNGHLAHRARPGVSTMRGTHVGRL